MPNPSPRPPSGRSPFTGDQLAAIRARHAALPDVKWDVSWDWCDCDDLGCGHGKFAIAVGPVSIESMDVAEHVEVAEFLGAAPADVATLLAEVDALCAELADLREQVRAGEARALKAETTSGVLARQVAAVHQILAAARTQAKQLYDVRDRTTDRDRARRMERAANEIDGLCDKVEAALDGPAGGERRG